MVDHLGDLFQGHRDRVWGVAIGHGIDFWCAGGAYGMESGLRKCVIGIRIQAESYESDDG